MRKKIEMFKVFMSPNAKTLVAQTLESGFIGQGSKVEEFETLLKDYLSTPFINTTNSATSALHLALHLCKDGIRDEVISTPLTCSATSFAITANNLKIKWADVNTENYNIDLDSVEAKLSDKTLAIMVVHWGGYPVDLKRLTEIQDKCESLYGHRPTIIEDSAHAWGSTLPTNNNFRSYSFQAIKHFTTGDGGCLISPSKELHERAKLLRWYGLDRTCSTDFRCDQNIKEWGFKFHMNDINASIGIANLPHSNNIIQRHKDNAQFYNESFGLKHNPNSSYWIYTMKVERRNDFVKMMNSKNIVTSKVHDRNDKHECLREYKTYLPGMDLLDKEMICIPCGWWVGDEDSEYIVDCVKGGW